MTKKYKILDHTDNTGKNYISENTQNCTEENAIAFDSEKEAFEWLDNHAEKGTKFFDNYGSWASVVPFFNNN